MRNRNTNRRGRFQRRPRLAATLRSRLNGVNIRPRPDPTQVISQPWNSVTLDMRFSQAVLGTPLLIGTSQLAGILRSQLGLPATVNFDFRLLSYRSYELSGGALGIRTYDLNTTDVISTQLDQPGRNRWATCGYSYPSSIRNNVLSSTTVSSVFQIESSAVGTNNILVHFSLLWRVLTADVPPNRSMINSFHFQPSADLPSLIDRSLPDLVSNNIPDT